MKSSSPILTIGLPVYNAAPFLTLTLRSILAQTFRDWELIAVDDGSTDGSAELLGALHDPRVRVLGDGRHRGLGACLNRITAQAAGQYIARMDADDLMHPERLQRQFELLDSHSDIDGVGCGLLVLDQNQRPVGVRRFPSDHSDIIAAPLRGISLAHASFVGRTDWFRRHPYNETTLGCEDWELWFTSMHESRFANLPELLYYYREFDSFSLRRYLRAKHKTAAFLWRHGRRLSGPLSALAACSRQYLNMSIYCLAAGVGCEELLIRRRSTQPDEACVSQFYRALDAIRATDLPLRDSVSVQ